MLPKAERIKRGYKKDPERRGSGFGSQTESQIILCKSEEGSLRGGLNSNMQWWAQQPSWQAAPQLSGPPKRRQSCAGNHVDQLTASQQFGGNPHSFVYFSAGEKSTIKNTYIRPESLKIILTILEHVFDFPQHKTPANSWFRGGKKSPSKMNNSKRAAVGSGNYSQIFCPNKKSNKTDLKQIVSVK